VNLTYADHEFVNYRLITRITDSSSSEAEERVQYEIDDDVLALDNDELAMVSWLDASLAAAVSGFSQDQDSNGSVMCSAEIGANLSGSEYLGSVGTDEVREVQSTGAATSETIRANDEPGLWAALNGGITGGFKDLSGDGGYYSGGGSSTVDRLRREYYAETMSGPYIDSTDNINAAVYVDKDSMGSEVRLQFTGQISFVIFEYDQRRAEFGPVPGGA